MSPTIRIDGEVWGWLKSHAQPFEDTPNSVLRRIAGLGESASSQQLPMPNSDLAHPAAKVPESSTKLTTSPTDAARHAVSKRVTGEQLNRRYRLGVRHALYHKDGTFYECLTRFPGALCDSNGYVRFESEPEFARDPRLNIGEKVNIHSSLSSHPRYRLFPGKE